MKEKEIAFIGKITAGVTHEVNNVFASIKEISGLMSDILSITQDNTFKHKEKFQTSVQKIQSQVQRGITFTCQLNKFSHLADYDKAETDLNEMTGNLILLTERFARIKNVVLTLKQSERTVIVSTNLFYLNMAMFYIIEYFFNHTISGGEIVFYPAIKDNQCVLSISFKGEATDEKNFLKDPDSELLKSLENIIGSFGGSYELNSLLKTIDLYICRL